jgi:hypothetical protein
MPPAHTKFLRPVRSFHQHTTVTAQHLWPIILVSKFLGWDETGSIWHVGHYLAYCTSPGWWMMMSVQQSVEWLAGETEVLGVNLSQCCFVRHKSHMSWARTRAAAEGSGRQTARHDARMDGAGNTFNDLVQCAGKKPSVKPTQRWANINMYVKGTAGLKSGEYGRRDPSRWPRGFICPQKLALTLPTRGGRSAGIVRSRNKAMEFFFMLKEQGKRDFWMGWINTI